MKKPLFITLAMALCFCLSGFGQSVSLKQTVRFRSGKSEPSAHYVLQLSRFIDSLKNLPATSIEVQGHTDNIGSYRGNKLLSEKRAIVIKDLMVKAGIKENSISVKAFGPDQPIATNKTLAGRRLNRRVEIIASGTPVPEAKPAPATVENIYELYKRIAPPPQLFCIDPKRDTAIRCAQGTVIYIKANSVLPSPDCGNACVTIHVKEVFTKADMVLNDLSTTSNGEIIETQGMIFTEAFDCKGKSLELEKGKDLVIVVPTDSIIPSAKIFDGNREHDSIMNWTVNNNSVLSNFTQEDMDECNAWICNRGRIIIETKPCSFFFCRIKRILKPVIGLVSRKQRLENRLFRQQQNELKRVEESGIVSRDPLTIETRPPLDPAMLPRCKQLEELFKKYGVTNMEGLIKAINKPLMDSFKVSTIQQLQDTLNKVAEKKFEMDYAGKKVSFNDFRYYVYNTSQFGWSNVDAFTKIPPSQLITLRVDLRAEPGIDCKLVFKNRRFVLPATKEARNFVFKTVPRGESAWIVAIKWNEGNAYLAIREITTSNDNFDIEFKQFTFEEMREKLRFFDR